MSDFRNLTTFGLEYESPEIFRNDSSRPRTINNIIFRHSHDASIESPVYVIDWNGKKYVPILKAPKNLRFENTGTLGTELVSQNPIPINQELEQFFKSFLCKMIQCGEKGISERAGIHFHLTLHPNHQILKEIINLASYLEDAFYLIGGMGRPFRGYKNNFIYCRPITKFGPTVIPTPGGDCQVFNTKDLIESSDYDDFKLKYGNINYLSSRYVPVRYTWINLLPLFRQSSLEFRVFNLTLNPIWMTACVYLAQAFAKEVMKRSFEEFSPLEENSVYDYRDKDEIISTMLEFIEGKIPDIYVDALYDIMVSTPVDSIRPRKKYVYSHLYKHPERGNRTQTHWRRGNYRPERIKNAIIPEFQDSHQISRRDTIIRIKKGLPNKKPKLQIYKPNDTEKDSTIKDYFVERL